MQDVDVDAAQAVDDLHQPVEADPGVVMDGNAKGLLDSGSRQRRAALLVGQVDLGAGVSRDRHPQVAGQREERDLALCRVDGYHDHGLREDRVLREFLVVVAPQQKNVDALLGIERRRCRGRRRQRLAGREIVVVE